MKKFLIILLTILTLPLFGQGRFPFSQTSGSPAEDVAEVHHFFDNNADDSSPNGWDAGTSGMVYGSGTPAQGTHFANFSSSSVLFQLNSNIVWGNQWAISVWIRHTGTTGFYELLSPHKSAGDWEYWRFWMHGPNKSFEFRGYQNSTSSLDIANTVSSVWTSTYVWDHVVLNYNNGIVEVYFNGSAVTMSNNTTWNTSNMMLEYPIMYLGQYFLGEMDDFSFYGQNLSSGNVTTLYNGGVAGTILTAF